MNIKNLVFAAALIALPATTVLAQSTTYHQRHSINARENRQQARINHGVRDGQITPHGAAVAERNQARVDRQVHNDRAANAGHLTAGERHKVAREQDRTSQGIYTRNHNAATDRGVTPR